MTPLYFLILAACVALSFFLSGMEAGVFALSRFRIRRMMREGHKSARLLHWYLEKREDFLWTILVGNTLANFVAVALAVVVLHGQLGTHGVWFWAILIPGGLLFYALCDLLPKMLFRLHPTRLCLLFLPPFRAVRFCLRPVVWGLSRISALVLRWRGGRPFAGGLFGTREELRLVMQESGQQLTSEERGMINRVLDLQILTVGRLMTPLDRAVSVSVQTPLTEALQLCADRGVTRLPVWRGEGSERRVAGFLNARALLYEADLDLGKTAGTFLKPALFLDESKRLEDALRQMQRSGQRLAIVLNRERKEVGVVSLQDILKAVFGEFKL